MAENRVALISRFIVSPKLYSLEPPLESMPVASSRVSCAPKLDLPSDPRRSFSVDVPGLFQLFDQALHQLFALLRRHLLQSLANFLRPLLIEHLARLKRL